MLIMFICVVVVEKMIFLSFWIDMKLSLNSFSPIFIGRGNSLKNNEVNLKLRNERVVYLNV